MCDVINLADIRRQKEERINTKAQDEAALPEFIQGGIESSEDCNWFLTNLETGKRARFIDAFEIEEVEEATILDFKPED